MDWSEYDAYLAHTNELWRQAETAVSGLTPEQALQFARICAEQVPDKLTAGDAECCALPEADKQYWAAMAAHSALTVAEETGKPLDLDAIRRRAKDDFTDCCLPPSPEKEAEWRAAIDAARGAKE